MKIIRRYEVNSTNDEVIRLTQSGEALPFWCIAEVQTSGRGRRGREWQSLTGNMFASGIYEIDKEPAQVATLSFVVSLSLFETLTHFIAEDKIKLKWPNDVLVNGKKISGILLESSYNYNKLQIIIGVGLNVAFAPQITEYQTTSISENLENGCVLPSSLEALKIFLDYFEKNLRDWDNFGIDFIVKKWLKHAHRLNEAIEINQGNNKFNGKFIDINNSGELLLQQPDGNIIKINSGEVLL